MTSQDFEPIWVTDNRPSKHWPLYTRGNIGEVFPEVVLPLTWDLYGQQAENGWRRAYQELGLLMPGDVSGSEDMVILGVFGGYAYINASYVRILGLRAPGGTVEAIDKQFFGESDAPAYSSRHGDKSFKSSLKLGKTIFRLLGTKSLPELETDKALVGKLVDSYPGDQAPSSELLEFLSDFKPVFEDLFARHILNTFSVALLSGAVLDLLVKVDQEDQLVTLLGGIGDVESAAPSSALWSLAQSAKNNRAINSAFDDGVPDLLERLASVDEASAWLDNFGFFIDEFGSRGPNEWDLGSDPWAFRPEMALVAIDRMRAADDSHDPAVQAIRLSADREVALKEAVAAMNPIDRFQFKKALAATTIYSQGRERSKTTIIRAVHEARKAQAELARRIAAKGGPKERYKTCLLSLDQLTKAVDDPSQFDELIEERAILHSELSALIPPFMFEGAVPDISTWAHRGGEVEPIEPGATLKGIAGCPGVATGIARIVLDAGDPGDLGPGDILVAPITDPSWTPLFLAADAVVVDVGATMSHAVIVSRELGIPCVVSAVGATETIPDGALIAVDGNKGEVRVLGLP